MSTTAPPTTEFTPQYYRYMLHRNVMVLAKTRTEGTWKAYCFPVPGIDHDAEEYLWRSTGLQVNQNLARQMFPFLKDLPYAD